MIPKFASQLLQLKSHGSHHIRNVLQSSGSSSLPWAGVGSSSSSWGGSTGAGGAKFNAGSRFYAGYTGPGRVLTQATSLPAGDGTNGQIDDSDELNPGSRTTPLLAGSAASVRRRRSSFALTGPRSRLPVEGHGSQQVSTIHTQAKHAFTQEDRAVPSLLDASPSRRSARRNSTSALEREVEREEVSTPSTPPLSDPSDPSFQDTSSVSTAPSSSELISDNQSSTTSPALQVASDVAHSQLPPDTPPAVPGKRSNRRSKSPTRSPTPTGPQDAADLDGEAKLTLGGPDLEMYNALRSAKAAGSLSRVMQEVHKLRNSTGRHSEATYNMALAALNSVRTKGMPIALVLELYNQMLERDLTPNPVTYANVIRALCDRDLDIHEMTTSSETASYVQDRFGVSKSPKENTPSHEHIQLLQSEENFASAMALFNASKALRTNQFGTDTYNLLLRSAGFRGDIDSAIRVYSNLERRGDIRPNIGTYGYLLSVYAQAGDIDGAREVFSEFQSAAQSGKLSWTYRNSDDAKQRRREVAARRIYMQVYNRMISAYFKCGEPSSAMTLLEEMLGTESKSEFVLGDVPPPSAATYTEVVSGFCESGDIESAVKWYERLLQNQATAPGDDSYAASKEPLRPDRQAWLAVSRHLAAAGQLETLHRLFLAMITSAPAGVSPIQGSDVTDFITINTNFLFSSDAVKDTARSTKIVDSMKDILPRCASIAKLSNQRVYAHEWLLIRSLVRIGKHSDALKLMESLVTRELEAVSTAGQTQVAQYLRYSLQRSILDTANDFMGTRDGLVLPVSANLDQALSLIQTMWRAKVEPNVKLWGAFVRLYLENRDGWLLKRQDAPSWRALRDGFLALDRVLSVPASSSADEASRQDLEPIFNSGNPFPGIEALLDDLRSTISSSESESLFANMLPTADLANIFRYIAQTRGLGRAQEIFASLGPLGAKAMSAVDLEDLSGTASVNNDTSISPRSSRIASSDNSDNEISNLETDATAWSTDVPSVSSASDRNGRRADRQAKRLKIDYKLSTLYDTQRSRLQEPLKMYDEVQNKLKSGVYLTPAALSLVIGALGRTAHLDKAKELYTIAQTVLASMESDKKSQTNAWFLVEDSMIIAHASAGDIDAANVHRARIIEQGGAPGAEAYAVLILSVNDFTDDCNVAVGLYNEALRLGVIPTVFLYNNIISKLSRARKAESALEIFHDMKKRGVRPTSVTYGALVGACCRVGDADTAMYLFSEMSSQLNFRPKAPPFNTMIQFFVHTKPDRERALYYYNLMVASNVQPSEHTFKLLMDAYGMIEPVDMSAVQIVFDQLVTTKGLQVQGTHWASLITAWGCSCKDVDRAQAVFDSIPAHPTTLASGLQLPDATTWEALINVMVTQHRFDLLHGTLERLRHSGIHMTAYIANVVIRGYSSGGEIERARAIFEGMDDPPDGMAASYSRSSSNATEKQAVAPDAPVFREPSTWEAMIRAEMGAGDRARAMNLLERMEGRHFPPAVEARIRGLVDQTVPLDGVLNLKNFQAWSGGSQPIALDYSKLPFASSPHYGPPPVDAAIYAQM